ncbi:hypothetical protein [Nostoc sp.]|uniref:hypothetical protein n=1 Tax=Nostoc sp. TaxID=1180 RepID=UPI002FF59439
MPRLNLAIAAKTPDFIPAKIPPVNSSNSQAGEMKILCILTAFSQQIKICYGLANIVEYVELNRISEYSLS